MAEVVRRDGALLAALALLGEPCRARIFRASHWPPPRIEYRQRLLPFVRFDAQEMVLLALLQEGHALAHPGVADDDAGLRLGECRAPCRRPPPPARRCRCRRRAATCQPNASNFGASGSKLSTSVRGAVGLLVVDVDDGDQVVELVAGRPTWPPSQVEPSSSSPSENRL